MPSPSDEPSHPRPEEGEQSTAYSRAKSKHKTDETETTQYAVRESIPEPVLSVEHQKTVISKQPTNIQQASATTDQLVGERLVGTQLEHFLLEEFVGKGGMGAVFRATDNKLGRTVAVKVLAQNRTDADSLRRFTKEAQSAARLDHPNIARVYYVGEDRGWHFIVFEYINGVNIRDLVEHKGPLPLDESWSYVLQITDALVHAAKRDVVHRDIKPSNILVTSEGTAKLVDMGLARLHQVENDDSDVTASGVTLGTFDYISPEQARDPRTTDVRSDIYSLGCTLYYMLTGLAPYPTGTVLQKLLSHSSDPPPNPQLYRNDLDDGSVSILHKMLSKRPQDRYQEPRDIIVDVLYLAEQLGLNIKGDGREWESPLPPARFNWLKQLSLALPVACLLMFSFGLDILSPKNTEVVMALPTFRTLPYVTPAAVPNSDTANQNPGEQAVEGPMTPSVASPDLDANALKPAELQTVVVGKPMTTLPDGFVAVDSLSRALSLLEQDSQIGVIEIWDDAFIAFDNLQLDLDNWLGHPLTIRGGNNSRPVITVELTESALQTIDPVFITVTGGRLLFERLDLRFQMPEEFRQSWRLFAIDRATEISFSNCSLTVLPSTPNFSSPIGPISIFNFMDLYINEGATNAEPLSTPQISSLEINNSLVRGSATLISSSGTTPVNLNVRNSLLISSGRMLDHKIPTNKAFETRLELTNVTAYCGAGAIGIKNLDDTGQTPLSLSFQDSVLVTDLGKPLIELEQSQLDALVPFLLVANNSAIDKAAVVLERRDQLELDLSKQETFVDLYNSRENGDAPVWFHMNNSINRVNWSNSQVPSTDLLLYQHGITEFMIEDFDDNARGFTPLLGELLGEVK